MLTCIAVLMHVCAQVFLDVCVYVCPPGRKNSFQKNVSALCAEIKNYETTFQSTDRYMIILQRWTK